MPGADWSSTITVNIVLAPLPPARQGFGIPLLIVDQDAGNPLGGSRIVSYANVAEAQAAQLAGQISTTTLASVTAAFSQIPTPSKVKVAYIDTSLSETYAAALAAISAVDNDWYGVCTYSRVAADVLALSLAIETYTPRKICVVQSNDSSWLDAGKPVALAALDNRERTAVVYHNDNAQPADFAWLASRLVFDPDDRSAGWEGEVRGVAAGTALTSTQRDFIVTNEANVGLAFSSAAYYVSAGVNQNGRPVYEIVTADWFAARVAEDFAAMKLAATARGSKVIVDATGQAAGLAILDGRLRQGEDGSHFPKGQTRATAEAITQADIDAKRLRFKVEAQIAADARLFVINVYLQSSPLQAA